jgi:hypothetical protein
MHFDLEVNCNNGYSTLTSSLYGLKSLRFNGMMNDHYGIHVLMTLCVPLFQFLHQG